jgi:hypothetical protein
VIAHDGENPTDVLNARFALPRKVACTVIGNVIQIVQLSLTINVLKFLSLNNQSVILIPLYEQLFFLIIFM